MSSTPVLTRDRQQETAEWVDIRPSTPIRPQTEPSTTSAGIVIAIATARMQIEAGQREELVLDVNSLRELDEDDIAWGQHAALSWDD